MPHLFLSVKLFFHQNSGKIKLDKSPIVVYNSVSFSFEISSNSFYKALEGREGFQDFSKKSLTG
jgi:hypothetical protein